MCAQPSPPSLLLRHLPKLSSYSPIKRLVRNRTVRAETKQATDFLRLKKQKQKQNRLNRHTNKSKQARRLKKIAAISSVNSWIASLQVKYQARETMFYHILKHWEKSWKYNTDATGYFWRYARCLELNVVRHSWVPVWYIFSIRTKSNNSKTRNWIMKFYAASER